MTKIEEIADRGEFLNAINCEKPVIVLMRAMWSDVCKLAGQTIKEFSEIVGEKVKILKIDVDENSKLADELCVKNIPTIIIFNKCKEVARAEGIISSAKISEMIIKYI